jgi:hypothetical protein
MKLFEIASEYEEILNNLYDEDGVINEQELIKLESNEIAMEKKAIAIASYIQNLNAEREAIANAKENMAKRENKYKKEMEFLQSLLLFNLQKRGINEVKCPFFEIKLKKCPLSVDDEKLDMDLLPEEYKRTKVKIEADKVKILQEMKEGVVIPGAFLKQNMRLQIK